MRFTALLFLTIAITIQTYGQGRLSLSEATTLAYATNDKIKASDYLILAAQREKQAALSLFSPQIKIHSGYVYAQKDINIDANPLKPLFTSLDIKPLLALDWKYTIQERNFGFIEADVTVPIFTGGKIISAVRAAKINEQIANRESIAEHQSIFTEVVDRYFSLSLARSVVSLRKLVVKGIERHLGDITALEAQGMATKAERLYAQYRLSEAEQQLSAAESTLGLAHRALCSTIGSDSINHLSTPIFYLPTIEELDYFTTLAAQNNTQLAEIRDQRALAKENIAIHRAEFFPEVVAMGSGALMHNVTNILPRWAVGIGVNFKLFDGLRREFKFSAAKNTYRRVEALERAAEQDINLLITSLYNRVTASLEQIIALERSIDFATEYLQMQQRAFTEGVATSTAVIDATIELLAVHIERLKCGYEFDTNLVRLLEACGSSDRYFEYIDHPAKESLIYEKE